MGRHDLLQNGVSIAVMAIAHLIAATMGCAPRVRRWLTVIGRGSYPVSTRSHCDSIDPGETSPTEKRSYRDHQPPQQRDQTSDQRGATKLSDLFDRSGMIGNLFHGVRSLWEFWREPKTTIGPRTPIFTNINPTAAKPLATRQTAPCHTTLHARLPKNTVPTL